MPYVGVEYGERLGLELRMARKLFGSGGCLVPWVVRGTPLQDYTPWATID